jgi:chemotaxis protein MotB
MDSPRLRLVLGLALLGLVCLGLSLAAFVRGQQERRALALLVDEARGLRDLNRTLQGQVDQLRKQIDERAALLQDKESRLATAEQARLSLEQERSARLLKERQQEESARAMREKLSSVIQAGDGTVLVENGRLTIRLANQILFRSGESRLREESRAALQAVAALLNNELAGYPVAVEGHTDNVPISDSMQGRFPSNWDLSASRACSAVRFLESFGNVDPARLTVIGHGDTRPLSSNDTPDGQALNRRIEFTINLNDIPAAPAPQSPAPPPAAVQ